jgi:hypothetical protein
MTWQICKSWLPRHIPTSTCVAAAAAGVATIGWTRTHARLVAGARARVRIALDQASSCEGNPCCDVVLPPVRPCAVIATTWGDLVLSAWRVEEGVAPTNEDQALLDRMMTHQEAQSLLSYLRAVAATEDIAPYVPNSPEGL